MATSPTGAEVSQGMLPYGRGRECCIGSKNRSADLRIRQAVARAIWHTAVPSAANDRCRSLHVGETKMARHSCSLALTLILVVAGWAPLAQAEDAAKAASNGSEA